MLLAEFDLVGLVGALGLLLGGVAAVLGALGKRKAQKAVQAMQEAIERFDPNAETIDDTTGEVVVDQKKNLRKAIEDRTEEMNVADVLRSVERRMKK
jgi:hypothetical protein